MPSIILKQGYVLITLLSSVARFRLKNYGDTVRFLWILPIYLAFEIYFKVSQNSKFSFNLSNKLTDYNMRLTRYTIVTNVQIFSFCNVLRKPCFYQHPFFQPVTFSDLIFMSFICQTLFSFQKILSKFLRFDTITLLLH